MHARPVTLWLVVATLLGACPSEKSVHAEASRATTGANPFCAGDHWRGQYYCAQGATELDLKITSVVGDTVTDGVFDFTWNGQVHGSFHVAGLWHPTTDEAEFLPGAWIDQPADYVTVAMYGLVDPGTRVFGGRIAGPGCGPFMLKRGAER